jgi:uncharacterized protein (DUF983 family)
VITAQTGVEMSEQVTSKSGVGFFGLLTILFVGLKLTGFIDWSWWAVTAPLWAPLLLVLALLAVVVILGSIFD